MNEDKITNNKVCKITEFIWILSYETVLWIKTSGFGVLEVLRVTHRKTDLHNYQSHLKVQICSLFPLVDFYRVKISLNSNVRPIIKNNWNCWLLSLFRIIRWERSMISQEIVYASIDKIFFFYYRVTLWFPCNNCMHGWKHFPQ